MLPLILSRPLQKRLHVALTLKAISAAMALALSGCGGGPGAGAYSFGPNSGASGGTTKGVVSDEVQFLADYMQDWYIFYKDLVPVDLSLFASSEEALETLRVGKDKFSHISSEAATTAFYDEGRLLAFNQTRKRQSIANSLCSAE
jgi:hypothetical protein